MKTRPGLLAVLVSAPLFIRTLVTSAIAAPAEKSEKPIPVSFVRRVMSFGPWSSQLWLGQLPEKLPVELPPLPNAELLGSETQQGFRDTIHLNSRESPSQVQAFYQATLPRLGWRQRQLRELAPSLSAPAKGADTAPAQAEPTGSKTSAQSLYFCHTLEKTSLQITTKATANAITEVKLSLQLIAQSQFCQSPQQRDRDWEQVENQMLTQLKTQLEVLKLFRLAAPPGSKEFPLGTDDALIRSALEPHRFTEHYASQMRLAGWKYQNSSKDQNFFWSTWTTVGGQGEPLLALLAIVAEPGLPEVQLFQDERGQVPGLNQANLVASRTAALPLPKSRQYLVALSVFDLNQEDRPTSSSQIRRDRSPLPPNPQDETQTIPESLALRFLGGFPRQLFPKQLPPQLPLQVPVPPTTELIGSYVDVMDESGIDKTNNVLFFNVRQPVEFVQQFYAKQGKDFGWSNLVSSDFSLSQSGFLETPKFLQFKDAGDGEAYTFLCDRPRGVEIVLQTSGVSSTVTGLRVDVRPGSTNCIESDAERKEDARLRESLAVPKKGVPIPILVAPADTQVDQGGETTLAVFYAQSAQITSKTLDGNALLQHYETQLQQQGWRSQARYITELIRWSHWRLTDKKGNQWHALLKFTQPQPSTQDYSAELTLIKSPQDKNF